VKTTLLQAIRFGIVGFISNGLGFCWYFFLTWLGMGPKVAMSLLFVIGVLQTFLFNKRWSFRYAGTDKSVLGRYIATYVFGYLLNLAMLVVLVDWAEFPHLPVQAAMILVVAALMFLLQKFWVFAGPAISLPNSKHDHPI
jgi:putative flippase GtrA